MGGGQDKLAWTAYPPPLQLSMQNNLTKKTAQFDSTYVYNRKKSSHSNSLKWENLAKKFYFETPVGGGQDKLAWTAYPPPL